MSMRVVDRVDGWEQRPFSGGYDALRDLADGEFSGVVRAGGAELYVTVGTVVAVRRGTIEDFEDASGTIFEAPVPALPLLAVMQEEDADVRAQYYTEETPISEVDKTLRDGGFTGFLELSENVLSGDYFQVYHGGNSMSVGYVGASEKLITDDEAFETAEDEVGIYKVRQVDVEPVEIPEPAGAEASAEATAAAATAEGGTEASETAADEADADEADTDEADTDEADADEATTDESDADDEDGAAEDGDESTATEDEASASADAEPESRQTEESAPTRDDGDAGADAATEARADTSADATDGTASADPVADDSAGTADGPSGDGGEAGTAAATPDASEATASEAPETTSGSEAGRGGSAGEASATEASSGTGGEGRGRSATGGERSAGGGTGGRGGSGGRGTGRSAGSQSSGARRDAGRTPSQTPGDLETRSIPSLDPNQTHVPSHTRAPEPATDAPSPPRQSQESRPSQGSGADEAARADAEPAPARDAREPAGADAADHGAAEAGGGGAALSELEDELADREAEIDRLESEIADATGEREDLETELESVREERDDLSTQVERLEEELERLEREFGAATDAEQRMTPTEAIEGTNLFVEYDSKGKATLEGAHGGSESREEVAENLRLGVHTEFDDRAVAVGGQDFGEFLQGTLHYRFAQWVVGDLLFEIRDTGHADALPDLYDAVPEIRRVEFNGVVDVEYVEDGQEKTARERFDVIFRHRMGDPLLVANLNDARDPATGGMMTSLVTAAERVGQSEEGLASAFLVTSSFFESEALETVSEATQGGLLSRDSRKSFVNLSRKAGYHLCLVAARDRNFHMEVPEL